MGRSQMWLRPFFVSTGNNDSRQYWMRPMMNAHSLGAVLGSALTAALLLGCESRPSQTETPKTKPPARETPAAKPAATAAGALSPASPDADRPRKLPDSITSPSLRAEIHRQEVAQRMMDAAKQAAADTSQTTAPGATPFPTAPGAEAMRAARESREVTTAPVASLIGAMEKLVAAGGTPSRESVTQLKSQLQGVSDEYQHQTKFSKEQRIQVQDYCSGAVANLDKAYAASSDAERAAQFKAALESAKQLMSAVEGGESGL